MAIARTCSAAQAMPSVFRSGRPLSAALGVQSGAWSSVSSAPEVSSILRSGTRTRSRGLRVSLPDMNAAEWIEYDPVSEGRIDVDLSDWVMFTGTPGARVSQTHKLTSNAWKMEPGRDLSHMAYHFAQACPSPPSYIKRCECVAQRNARELAEHLGLHDFQYDSQLAHR